MNKKQLCENSLSISYYSGFNSLEVKAIFQKNTALCMSFLTLGMERKNIISYEYTVAKMVNIFV